MNKPALGDRVVFYPAAVQGGVPPMPCEGMVIHVWSDSCVNLACEDETQPTSVLYKPQGSKTPPPSGYYCEPLAAVDPVELEIQAKGLTAPRVTPADVEAVIASENYFSAGDGIDGAAMRVRRERAGDCGALELVTICVLVLRNGTKIVGVNEGPVSPENFDADIGRKLARRKATDQIWPLLGYELRSDLAKF